MTNSHKDFIFYLYIYSLLGNIHIFYESYLKLKIDENLEEQQVEMTGFFSRGFSKEYPKIAMLTADWLVVLRYRGVCLPIKFKRIQ